MVRLGAHTNKDRMTRVATVPSLLLVVTAAAVSVYELPNRIGSIDIVDGVPSPSEFFPKYTTKWGVPVLFRGAARNMPAFSAWKEDAVLKERYGNLTIQYEAAKKETRKAGGGEIGLAEFVDRYQTDDIYTVSGLPGEMASEVLVPRFLRCGYSTSYLDVSNLWWASGGQRSVIHSDGMDNVNCLFDGRKRIAFWHPKHKPKIESKALGWVVTEEENADAADHGKDVGYGSYSGKMDVEAMDLETYPGWSELDWYDATLEAGDCLFIPAAWYHTVASYGRNIAVNIWWWRRDRYNASWLTCPAAEVGFDVPASAADATADATAAPPAAVASAPVPPPTSLANCTFGYNGPPTSIPAAKARKSRAKQATHCAGLPAIETSSSEVRHATSFITEWLRADVEEAADFLQKDEANEEVRKQEL